MPFPKTIESAVDKVRAALSTSAQRELLTLVARAAAGRRSCAAGARRGARRGRAAWFESRTLRIVYEKKAWQLSPRLVRIRNLVFDRQVTLLNCIDLESGQDRQFRLDKIKQATVQSITGASADRPCTPRPATRPRDSPHCRH